MKKEKKKQSKMAGINLHFNLSIKLTMDGFLLQNLMLRSSDVKIILCV